MCFQFKFHSNFWQKTRHVWPLTVHVASLSPVSLVPECHDACDGNLLFGSVLGGDSIVLSAKADKKKGFSQYTLTTRVINHKVKKTNRSS